MSEKRLTRQSGEAALAERTRAQPPRPWKVVLHNDDYTTMEFVIEVIMRFFDKPHVEAARLTLLVHHVGHAVVGTYPRDIAETKVARVVDHARSNGHPLLCTCEPE